MWAYVSILLLQLLAGQLVNGGGIAFHPIGEFDAKSPSFLSLQHEPSFALDKGIDGSQNWTLLVSSFSGDLFAKDGVYVTRNIQEKLTASSVSSVSLTEISDKVVWPNEFNIAPESVFGGDIACAGTGFLVPGKTKGTVSLFNMSTTPISGPFVITSSSSSWFYHRIVWHDMNGDGRLDALTARADKPFIGSTKSELLWLEQPASDPLNSIWQEHSLATGPDVFFILLHLPVDGVVAPHIMSASYFSKKLQLFWPKVNATSGKPDWSAMSSRLIDELDAPFDLKPVDANADGQLDIIVTVNNEKNGSVNIYEVPDDFRNPSVQWPKHVISTGYHAIKESVGRGSPGSVIPVCPLPSVLMANGTCSHAAAPSFVLSGDDGGDVFVLSPVTKDWQYSQEAILKVDGTVGQLALQTMVGGQYQLLVPDFNGNKIHLLST